MNHSEQDDTPIPRCILCPATCELHLTPCGPDQWRSEVPERSGIGLCPRATALGELAGHRRRILLPRIQADGQGRQVQAAEALDAVLQRACSEPITFLADGSMPLEELGRIAAWCAAWPAARLCIVVEPAERDLLEGLEASPCAYPPPSELAGCDGFLLIGDVFAANPTCARGVLDARNANRRLPIVALDPACGSAWKFASHAPPVAPGGEAQALAAVIRGAGIDAADDLAALAGAADGPPCEQALAAGEALADCERLGVLIAAEYGRTGAWRQIGYMAGCLAHARGGGAWAQTSGANALGAVRLARQAEAAALEDALAGEGVRVALGCDLCGMLGREDLGIAVAAAALPNKTTAAAEVVWPMAMPCEWSGTAQPAGGQPVAFAAALAPPSGVGLASDLVAALARKAGVDEPPSPALESPPRLDASPPAPAERTRPGEPAVLLARQAAHAGCGALTGHASWQQACDGEAPEARLGAAWAAEHGLRNLAKFRLRRGDRVLPLRVHIAPELQGAVLVMGEHRAEARALCPAGPDGRMPADSELPAVEVMA